MTFQLLGVVLTTFLIARLSAYKALSSKQRSSILCSTKESIESRPFENVDANQWDLKLKSPCKLNLFLRILNRRPSGFHDLASLFQTISLSDRIYMSKLPNSSTEDEIYCSDKSLSVGKSNLVVKALDLMRTKTGIQQFFRLYLDKIVPMQAGLGGGSSNAATAMHGFNVLCGYPASQENLLLWSGDIGSDISFFFSSGTAYCTGRGEIVQSLPALPLSDDVEVHVFKPAEGLSTALVFKALDLNKCSTVVPESILHCFETDGALKAAANDRLINDLEAPAFSISALQQLKSEIAMHDTAISGVMMSGSGTSVYALRSKSNPTVFPFDEIAAKFPGLRHYQCSFVGRTNDLTSWYQ
mmetsp:Transcript_3675/g.5031  ORF Transcript_3675/g.5031 Transcript_3675/m.5031 type:complete len:356 (+) Transcript_3675:73-1140(+)